MIGFHENPEPFDVDTCVCGCPEGGSHVDYVIEHLEPCRVEGCAILLCGACKCPEHVVYAQPQNINSSRSNA